MRRLRNPVSLAVAWRVLATLLLAFTYFAFRVELFSDEAEEHFHDAPSGVALNSPSVSWETYDKDNAPQAFTVEVLTSFELSFEAPPEPEPVRQDQLPFQPVRDKSPPSPDVVLSLDSTGRSAA
jgi:hypothetical protein